jgi:hypothetical protein
MRDVWINTASNVVYVFLNVVVAIIIFSIGWAVAIFIGKIVGKIIGTLKLDSLLRKVGIEKMLNKGNVRLNSAGFVDGLVKWFIIAMFFMMSLHVLGLDAVAEFIQTVLVGYFPKVIIAVLILLVSIILSEVIEKFVVAVSSSAHLRSSKMLGTLAKWAIIIFAILAVLVQLNIAPELIQILFIGIVSALSLAFGLAFGLGGRDHASRAIGVAWEKISRTK